MADFKEEDHPRGKDGRFTDGVKPSNKKQSKFLTVRGEEGRIPQNTLSKHEWSRFYSMLNGAIAGYKGFIDIRKNRYCLLNNKLIFFKGGNINPKIQRVLIFNSEEIAYKYYEGIKNDE